MAVAFKEASTPEFKEYSKQIVRNAKTLCEALMKRGYVIASGGTDNHLFLVDVVKSINRTGSEASDILEKANITVNKNAVPHDTRKPWDPSVLELEHPH
jgi:glycine hydroxymethyltransferase